MKAIEKNENYTRNKNGILYYQIEGFNFHNNMTHVFSTRIGWEQDKLFENLSEILQIPKEKIYSAKQVHGTDIVVITKENNPKLIIGEKDGLITNVNGIALVTYHADCVPVYFYDNNKDIIGLAHAGWKGTLNNICKNMVENMIKYFDSKINDIKIGIGPSIGPCCYEIGHDLESIFRDKYPNNPNIISEKNDKIFLDLWEVNKINLLNLGINEKNIYSSGICTSCNVDKFYSYRKEKGTKNRMIAAIMLKK